MASSTDRIARQRLVVDLDQLRGGARLVERRGRDGGDRLALVLDQVGRKQRLVAADRRDVVLARNVGRGDGRDDARRRERAGEVDAADAGMRVRAQHQRGFERARRVRHVVDVERAAGDVADGAVVADGGVDAAADACERGVHSASTRVGAARCRLELQPAHQVGGRAQPVGGAAAMVAHRGEVARDRSVDLGWRNLVPGAAGEGGFELRGALRAGRHAAVGGADIAHDVAVERETERRHHGRDVLVEALGELVGDEPPALGQQRNVDRGDHFARLQRGLAIAGDERVDRQRARAAHARRASPTRRARSGTGWCRRSAMHSPDCRRACRDCGSAASRSAAPARRTPESA